MTSPLKQSSNENPEWETRRKRNECGVKCRFGVGCRLPTVPSIIISFMYFTNLVICKGLYHYCDECVDCSGFFTGKSEITMFSTFLNGDDGGSLKERERKGIKENKHFAAIITDDRD